MTPTSALIKYNFSNEVHLMLENNRYQKTIRLKQRMAKSYSAKIITSGRNFDVKYNIN